MSGYPNLYALTNGGVSGRLSEWPLLPIEARRALGEIETLRAEVERLRAVVEKFAVHGETCRVRWSVKKGDSCSCGLADALAARAKGGRDG